MDVHRAQNALTSSRISRQSAVPTTGAAAHRSIWSVLPPICLNSTPRPRRTAGRCAVITSSWRRWLR